MLLQEAKNQIIVLEKKLLITNKRIRELEIQIENEKGWRMKMTEPRLSAAEEKCLCTETLP